MWTRRDLMGLLLGGVAAGLGMRAVAPPAARAAAGGRPPSPSRSRNYDPATYLRMLERARGTARLARRGRASGFASGVLIAPDRLLTCRHVIEGRAGRLPADALEIRFDLARDDEPTVFPVRGYAHVSDALDLCVLAIAPAAGGEAPAADRVQTPARGRSALDEGLYLVHHPRGGPLQIADDARVHFPFEATPDELEEIAARLGRQARDPAHARHLLAELAASYRPAAGGLHRNFSSRWAGQPTLGTDPEARDGSSGGPVYSKRTHEWVGILFAGVDERQARIPSTWEHHEAVLPAAAIRAALALG